MADLYVYSISHITIQVSDSDENHLEDKKIIIAIRNMGVERGLRVFMLDRYETYDGKISFEYSRLRID